VTHDDIDRLIKTAGLDCDSDYDPDEDIVTLHMSSRELRILATVLQR